MLISLLLNDLGGFFAACAPLEHVGVEGIQETEWGVSLGIEVCLGIFC